MFLASALSLSRVFVESIWEYVKEERAVISQAPMLSAALVILGIALWGIVGKWIFNKIIQSYQSTIANKDSSIESLREQVALEKSKNEYRGLCYQNPFLAGQVSSTC